MATHPVLPCVWKKGTILMQPVASYGYGRQKAKNPACPSPRHASSGWHGVTTNRFERLSKIWVLT